MSLHFGVGAVMNYICISSSCVSSGYGYVDHDMSEHRTRFSTLLIPIYINKSVKQIILLYLFLLADVRWPLSRFTFGWLK
jgi:hypothetical protein